MTTAIYYGCAILNRVYTYEAVLREVFKRMGVEVAELRDAHCCGGRLRSASVILNDYLAARVLAIARKRGFKRLVVPCNWCYYSMLKLWRDLSKMSELEERIRELLAREGLTLPSSEDIEIVHVVDFFYENLSKLKTARKLQSPVALFIGCRAVRPRTLIPNATLRREMLAAIIECCASEAIDFSEQDSCCGFGVLGQKRDTALTLAGMILASARQAGADLIVVTCPNCFEMLDYLQDEARSYVKGAEIPVLLLPQLVAYAMGLDERSALWHLNKSNPTKLTRSQSPQGAQ